MNDDEGAEREKLPSGPEGEKALSLSLLSLTGDADHVEVTRRCIFEQAVHSL